MAPHSVLLSNNPSMFKLVTDVVKPREWDEYVQQKGEGIFIFIIIVFFLYCILVE